MSSALSGSHIFDGFAMTEPTPRAGELELSVLILCRDEEKAIAHCVGEALGFLKRREAAGEVVVVDNGSRDRSAVVARAAGARVVHEARAGYGNAIIARVEAASAPHQPLRNRHLAALKPHPAISCAWLHNSCHLLKPFH